MSSKYTIEKLIDVALNQSNWSGYSQPHTIEIPDDADGSVVTVQINSTYLYHKIPRVEYEINITYDSKGLEPSTTHKITYNLYPHKGSTDELLAKIERSIKRLTKKEYLLELPVKESPFFDLTI